jgi:alanine racemase
MFSQPYSVKIDLSAISHNLNQVKKLAGPDADIMGIVKSDAYGHGLIKVAGLLVKNGVRYLGVSHVYEAITLRENGIKIPIIILCGITTRGDAELVVDRELTPMVFDMSSASLLSRIASGKGKTVNVHVKIDTGMGRLGIRHSEAEEFLKIISEKKGLFIEGLASHLSSADEQDRDFTMRQIKDFKNVVNTGRSMGMKLPMCNLANSAGIMAYKESHFDLVRPGIMLYGGLPSPDFSAPLLLKPAMTFKSSVLQVKNLPGNTPVSYGRKYYTDGPRKIASVSVGYGDGLSRSIGNRGHVLIKGKKAPVAGTVCMNIITCDVTEIHDITPGDEVVLLGSQGDKTITGDDMARWAETVSYEIFCSIGQRADKEYI